MNRARAVFFSGVFVLSAAWPAAALAVDIQLSARFGALDDPSVRFQ